MAKIELQKIRVTGLKGHYEILIKELQRRGILDIKENHEFSEKSIELMNPSLVDDFDVAKVEFAINYLSPFATKKGKLESMLTGGKLIMSEKDAKSKFANFEPNIAKLINECEKIEEYSVKAKNEISNNKKKIGKLENFAGFKSKIGENLNTESTKTILGRVLTSDKKDFLEKIARNSNLVDIDIFHSNKRDTFFRFTYSLSVSNDIEEILNNSWFNEVDLSSDFSEFTGQAPNEILESLVLAVIEQKKQIAGGVARKIELAKDLDNLKIVYDFYTWKKDADAIKNNVFCSKYLFAFEAWIEKDKYTAIEHWIKQVFVEEVIVEKIEKELNERSPALLKNNAGAKSFELITKMYGAPADEDIDPTLGLAPFFILFFGICLSDTGYGIILFLVASFFLLFGKFSKEAKTSLWMIFMLGCSAFVGGILLGGHLGMTVYQAPSFLTTTNQLGELVFRGQILDPMKGTGAMTFLLATFAIGLFQLLFGLIMQFIKYWTKKNYISAFADSATWFFFIITLVGWALAEKIGLPKDLLYYLMMTGIGILILTQGRGKKHKNIVVSLILKLIFGILGLYGIMDYISNMLSYSRLMALGLSTGIIGSAMNMTAAVLGEMIPGFIGILVMIAFLIFGHTINFGLSTMGAFIHTMRLQFIEFFGVFYSGGGEIFKPFTRIKKYLLFRS